MSLCFEHSDCQFIFKTLFGHLERCAKETFQVLHGKLWCHFALSSIVILFQWDGVLNESNYLGEICWSGAKPWQQVPNLKSAKGQKQMLVNSLKRQAHLNAYLYISNCLWYPKPRTCSWRVSYTLLSKCLPDSFSDDAGKQDVCGRKITSIILYVKSDLLRKPSRPTNIGASTTSAFVDVWIWLMLSTRAKLL